MREMTDKQINLKLPDAMWHAAKIKAAQKRVSRPKRRSACCQGVGTEPPERLDAD